MAESVRRLLRRQDDVALVESPGRVALVRLFAPAEPPMVLEGSSAVVWGLLDGTRDRAAVLDTLSATFALPADDIADDVDFFLDQLAGLGLVEDTSDASMVCP